MKELNEKKLNDELTIVGLILIVAFILYYLSIFFNQTLHLTNKVIEAQKTAIFLDKRLEQTEQTLIITNQSLTQIQDRLSDYEFLDKIKKDIDRNGLEPE